MIELGVITSIIIAVSQGLKEIDFNKKLIPIVNVLLGISLCMIFENAGLKESALNGIIVGLTASGLYSSAKNVKQFIKEEDHHG